MLLTLSGQIESLEPSMIFRKNLEIVDVVLLLRAVVPELGCDGRVLIDSDVEEDGSDDELRRLDLLKRQHRVHVARHR